MPPTVEKVFGSNEFDSERVVAYELGYRLIPADKFFLDFAIFFNKYRDLQSKEPGSATAETVPLAHTLVPFFKRNKLEAESYGGEVAATWNVTKDWKLNAGYSLLQIQAHRTDGGTDTGTEGEIEGNSPHNQFNLRSYLNLRDDLEFDLLVNYVDSLPATDIHSYIRLDARICWHIKKSVELSIVAQNLLDNRHLEFGPGEMTDNSEVERSIFAKLTWRF